MFTLRDDEADARMAELHELFCARRFDPHVSHMVRVQGLDGRWRSVKLPNIEAVEAWLERARLARLSEETASEMSAKIIREYIIANCISGGRDSRIGVAPAGPTPTAGVPVIPPTGALTYAP